MTTLEIIQRHVGGCREWIDGEYGRCGKPSEYVLWGKLISSEGLGPRCYEHAAKYVPRHGLNHRRSEWAIIHLTELADAIDPAKTIETLREAAERAQQEKDGSDGYHILADEVWYIIDTHDLSTTEGAV